MAVEQETVVTTSHLARTCDWSTTALGPRHTWASAVEHVVAVLLEAPVPMCYQHGPSLAMVYNDAFATLLGHKHPGAFAMPTPQVVSEVWDQPNVGPAFQAVLDLGEPFLEEGVRLRLRRGRDRNHDVDVGYYLRAGSPVRNEAGEVLGVLHIVLETTKGVERIQAVAGLASSLAVAVTVDDVCKAALHHALAGLPAVDAMICLPPSNGGAWRTSWCRPDEVFSPGEERLPLVWSDLQGPELARVLQALDRGRVEQDGLVVVPVPIDGRQGALCLRLDGRALPADAETVLLSSAALVGQAVARAQLFDRERTTAEMLQRALLPQTLPQSSSFTLAGRYEPVATGAVVGGDFYDAFPLPDGRIALVIGDVVGRGVAAATIMGQIRAATRGAALSDPNPQSVMTSLDTLVEGLDDLWPASVAVGQGGADQLGRGLGGGFGGELFVTMLYGLLDPCTGDLTLASAGHCAPAVVSRWANPPGRASRTAPGVGVGSGPDPRAGGHRADDVDTSGTSRSRIVDLEVGPPLGVGGNRRVRSLRLGPGEMLLAFTDGLLERRTQPFDQSEQRLLDFLDTLRCDSPRSACQQVLEAMGTDGAFEDDCALLAVGRTSVEHHSVTLVVPPAPEAVRPAREWARMQLEEWGIGSGPQFAVVTGLSELVTNAVLHAGTDAYVTLELDGPRLTVTVSDTGSRGSPQVVDVTSAGTRGRGLTLVQSVSDAFGSYPSPTGSTVWFEVDVELAERVGSGG